MKLKNLLLPIATVAILSSCAYLSKSMKKIYNTNKIVNLLELAVKENIAKVDSVSNTRRIRLDLNHLDDKDSKKRGIHEENHPSLYKIFGVDEIIYIDAGKKGYSEEDTLITNASNKYEKINLLVKLSLRDSKRFKNGIPKMNSKYEIHYGAYTIRAKNRKESISQEEEYYRFMNKVENFLENKLIKVEKAKISK